MDDAQAPRRRRVMGPPAEHFFSPCPRGLEKLLSEELVGLGAQQPAVLPGGVAWQGNWRAAYRANLESRLATRVLWRVAQTAYRREEDLYDCARAVAWERWFGVRQTLRAYTSAIDSPLKSLNFATLRIKDAVCDRFRDRFGRRPDVDTHAPDVRIHLFLERSQATLYLDLSGEPLYKRGYKRAWTEAPLKENLAAGILLLSGWDRSEPLYDPFCGSGTFLLEAAQMALGQAPGAARQFGLERLGNFDERLWREVQARAQAQSQPVRALPIFGSDADPDQVRGARLNLQAAGLSDAVTLACVDVLASRPPAGPPGTMIANPPYGVRVGDQASLAEFYPRLGDHLKQHYGGWRCDLFSGDPELPRRIGLRASRRIPLMNGAIDCRLYEYRIMTGNYDPRAVPA